jgi:FlaA1/EpsC-like NDP-sugar epimerase
MIHKTINNLKKCLAISHDALAAALAWFLAYQLRFNFEVPPEFFAVLTLCLPGVVLIQMIGFYLFGLYRGIWRFASVVDLQRIVISAMLTALIVTAGLFMVRSDFGVPRSVLILDPILLILMMGGSRFFYRVLKEHQLYGLRASRGDPVIIIGAGTTAVTLAKELARGDQWRVVGLLDDDRSLHSREVSGVSVLGGLSDLSKAHQRFGFNHIIIASPNMGHAERRAILRAAILLGVEALTIPVLDDLISGRLTVSQIRPVDVEDLLGRDVVNLDTTGLQGLIQSQSVLVSGAGGSIGSELCRQILKFQPSQLICLDISEFALYQLEQGLNSAQSATQLIYVVGDVKNELRLAGLFSHFKPSVVFHAAAYKHVPLMENDNVAEALNNNVLGTYTLARASKAAGVAKFVLISTDKAVNPTNVMGASKRLAEMVCQGLQEEQGTRFVMVRFGNVLGSSGSVIPKFREQIKAGGPITVTHPEITRYFMSIPEAAQLVLQAGLMGAGGEVFVLDMGEPVRIVDLAKDMIKLSGLQEDEIAIEFSGLRPGEKLYEELLADDEHTLATHHEKLRIANVRMVDALWVTKLMDWVASTPNTQELQIKQALQTWVPEYTPDFK